MTQVCLPVVRVVGQPRQALPGFGAGRIGLDGGMQQTARSGGIAPTGKNTGGIKVDLGLLARIDTLSKAMQACPVVCQSSRETPLC